MADPLLNPNSLSRRLVQAKRKNQSMSAVQKVAMLEKTLNVFQAEVNIKLKIMQQILTTRNEQVLVQKELLAQEQALYDTLLGHWIDTSMMTTTVKPVSANVTEEYNIPDYHSGVIKPDSDYLEPDYDDVTPGPSKKSKSSLRRKRKSGSPASRQNQVQNVAFDTGDLPGPSGQDETHNQNPLPCDKNDWEWDGLEGPYDMPVQVEMSAEGPEDADNETIKIKLEQFDEVDDDETHNSNGTGNLKTWTQTSQQRPRPADYSLDQTPKCSNVREGIICGSDLRLTTRRNRKKEPKPCFRCPKKGCQSYYSTAFISEQYLPLPEVSVAEHTTRLQC